MKSFYVDLRSFPKEKADLITLQIQKLAFDVYPSMRTPGLYQVMWEHSESISDVFKLPADIVTTYLPDNS